MHCSRRNKAPEDQKKRINIVLYAEQGLNNTQIAAQTGVSRPTVYKWREKWAQSQEELNCFEENATNPQLTAKILEVFADAYRPGKPTIFNPDQIAQIYALACEIPSEIGLPISHWTSKDIAAEAIDRGIVESISASYVVKLLRRADLKPHRTKYWETPPSTRS